jgi:GMP synthase (glutamine-hydrolysing)
MRPAHYPKLLVSAIFCLMSVVSVAADADPWRSVFNRLEDLANSDTPVVCVLNIQHPEIVREQLTKQGVNLYSGKKFPERVQALSGMRVLHFHFTEVTGNDLDRPNVKAILIGGRSKSLSPDRDPQFFSLIRNTKIPLIGFCGGMQLIGKALGGKVERMRKLRDGEADPNPKYHPGMFKEWGFLPVKITHRDPLFESLPDELLVREAHVAHMVQVPADFEVLAATAECPVEAIKHRRRLLYGTQFHPEAYDDDHPHGRIILQNFLRLAGITPQSPARQAGK